jgi:hypothetical protein
VARVGAFACAVIAWCGAAEAQQPAPGYPPPGYPPPGYPPPGYGYPPPGYGYPPPAYPYPPGAYYPPPAAAPPAWKDGDPVPRGYHVEYETRRGLIIAGSVTMGVPYVIGLSIASSADFENSSGWLAVPALGPWLMMAFRDDQCDEYNNQYGSEVGDCLSDSVIRVYLTLDGLAQAAGAIMLTVGLADKKSRLVANESSRFVITPTRVGSGYGLGALGRF